MIGLNDDFLLVIYSLPFSLPNMEIMIYPYIVNLFYHIEAKLKKEWKENNLKNFSESNYSKIKCKILQN